MASSTPFQSVRKTEYDVFLSFRGKDTRNTFVTFLFNELNRNSIHTFKDDVELRKGKCISTLLNIIKETRFAIVVFSKDYASAKWCLEEIATIMECQQQYGEDIVIPIFYDVEPSVVCNQTESFAESFKRHEEKNIEKAKVERWKNALKKAGQISGYHLKNDFNGCLAKCCEEVTKEIFTRVNQSTSTVLENNFAGLESRVQDVANMLLGQKTNEDGSKETNDVQFIGICGMGGIGKTKIAMTVFNMFSSQFDTKCFLENVKQHKTITELQETLLGKLLNNKMGIINNVDDGKWKIQRCCGRKKVLIVLDDINNVEQLEILAGSRNWFGRGSRVIITTRESSVLVSHGVDEDYIYRVNTWDDQEAIQLFCWYAFKMKIPKTGFKELCESIVDYAKGLPLALKLLGSHLCGQETEYWESILVKLKDFKSLYTPKDEITEVLMISFVGLDPDNRNVFLDIACFFRNWRKEYVEAVLDSNLRVLIAKSLISVQNGRIAMHDLLQEMGLRIANEEEPRRRVWHFKEVRDVFCGEMNHPHIEGICLWKWLNENISRTFEITLRKTRNLKLLKAGGCDDKYLRVNDKYLPSSLRWLEFESYHFELLPRRFESSMLVGLSLRKSSLLNCNFTTKSDKLTILDLSSSSSLLETPDFEWMPNLMRLNLSCCIQLEEIHPSIGNLEKLICLNLRKCSNIKKLPSFNHVSVSPLESLDLAFCKKIENFPEIKAKTSLLVELDLREVGIIEVPPSIQQLDALTKLSLDDCEHLASLPEDLYCQNPNELPKLPANIREVHADCRFKIALAIECSELDSVSYCDDDNPEVGTFLSEEFIHRNTPLLVSYLITAAEDNRLKMNQMLRSFKYRRYQSNGISIHLNSPWYSQKFVGFVVCFLCLEGDIWGPHSYQDIDQSMKHSTVIAKFSHKDSENEVLQTNCVIAGLAIENDDVKGHVCFAFIPVRSLWGKSKAIKDYSRFELQFMNLKASADWGCSLLYERQTGASERRYRHNGSHSELTTDDIACLTLMELGETEYLNLNRLNNSPRLLEYCSQLNRLGLRYFDISGCQTLKMPPTLPSAIREVYAHSNLASESTIAELASKYSELYSVSFSHKNNKDELNLSAEKLAKKFAHLPSQSRNSPFIVTYPTLTDIDTKRWFKYSSRHSNKVSINLNPSWYRQTFEGFVVNFLLKGRLHTWESHPNIRPFRHCEVIAKLIHKDNGNSVQTCCKIGRLYDEEFDFNEDEFMIWFAYIPFRSLSIPSAKANDYSVFEVAFRDTDSNNLSHCSCGLLYKNDKSLSEAIRSDANDLDEEAPNTEHSFEEASMATTQPGAIIGENPRHSNIKNGKKKKKRKKRNGSIKKKKQIKRRKMADHNNNSNPGKEGEDKEMGEPLDGDEDGEEYEANESNAGNCVEVAMPKYNDSGNEKEKEREDEQRKRVRLNNDKAPNSLKQNKKTNYQSDELSTGTQPPIVGDDVLQHLWDKFNYLLASFPRDKDCIELEIDQAIFHYTNTRSIFVMINDIQDLMRMYWLDVSIIQFFILFLNRLCNQLQVTSIGFVCPAQISKDMVTRNVYEVMEYFNHVMKQHKNKQFILAPYHQVYHWLLLVICIRSKSVYVLDPLPSDRTIEIKDILNKAFHSASTNERVMDINWKQCKCPIQPGGVECGYYVMRYMFDIVTKYSSVDCLDKAFESNKPYLTNEIDEIRELWAKYFLEECVQTEEGSVFTQLDLVTGEAEHSEQTPVDEDCEAEVEANQGTREAKQSEPNPANEDCEAAQKFVLTQLEHDIGEAEQSEPNLANEDFQATQKSVLTQLEPSIGEAEHSEPNLTDEDCEATQKSVLTQLKPRIGVAEQSEPNPTNEDCEATKKSVFTQLEPGTGEAEQSEPNLANEDCEATQKSVLTQLEPGTGEAELSKPNPTNEDCDAAQNSALTQLEPGTRETQQSEQNPANEDCEATQKSLHTQLEPGTTGEAKVSEPNLANEDCEDAQKSVLTQLEPGTGEAELSEPNPTNEDCEAAQKSKLTQLEPGTWEAELSEPNPTNEDCEATQNSVLTQHEPSTGEAKQSEPNLANEDCEAAQKSMLTQFEPSTREAEVSEPNLANKDCEAAQKSVLTQHEPSTGEVEQSELNLANEDCEAAQKSMLTQLEPSTGEAELSEPNLANEDCEAAQKSVLTQLEPGIGEAEQSEPNPANEDCEAAQKSKLTQLEPGIGEAEQSEPNPTNEDCEAAQKYVLTQLEHDIGEAEQSEPNPTNEDSETAQKFVLTQLEPGTGEAEQSEPNPANEDCEASQKSVLTQLEHDIGEAEQSEPNLANEDFQATQKFVLTQLEPSIEEAEQSEPNPTNEDCEATQKSVLTQLEPGTGEAEQSEQNPTNEDCEAKVHSKKCGLIRCFWKCS